MNNARTDSNQYFRFTVNVDKMITSQATYLIPDLIFSCDNWNDLFLFFFPFFPNREHPFKEVNSDCQGTYQGRVSTLEKTVASCPLQLPESELSLQVSFSALELDLSLALVSIWILMSHVRMWGRWVGRSDESCCLHVSIAKDAGNQYNCPPLTWLHSRNIQPWIYKFMTENFLTMYLSPVCLTNKVGKKYWLKRKGSLLHSQHPNYARLW